MDTLQNNIDKIPAIDKPFLISPETGTSLSYQQLQSELRKINDLLDKLGIAKGETVGFLLDNGVFSGILFLGIIYSGRVALPLNAVAGKNNLSYTIAHAEVRIIFLSEGFLELYQSMQVPENVLHILCDENSGLITPVDTTPAKLPKVKDDDVAVLIYTSGTTGKPKGVLLSHKNIIAGGNNTVLAHELSASDTGLCVLPLYHINAEMVSLMATLLSFSTLIIPLKLSISNFWHWIQDYKCTWFSVVPTIVSYLIHNYEKNPANYNGSVIKQHIRFGRSASAPLSPEVHKKFEQLFGISLIETMGISEAAAQILSNPMQADKIKYGSPGVAVGNKVKIFSSDNTQAAAGEKGEIVVKGDNIMLGYLKNQEETSKAIDADGWFHTGDIGYMDEDGFVYVTGRLKELIIKGGENIAPREIDDVLYQYPGILEAAAFAVADEQYGQDVMVAVVLKNQDLNLAELKEYCKEHLGSYKTPQDIMVMDELPKGPSGKIQRLKVAEIYAAQ